MNISAITSLNANHAAAISPQRNSLPAAAKAAQARFDMNDTLELTGAEKISREPKEPVVSKKKKELTEEDKKFRDVMHKLVGEVMFGQMFRQLRASQEPNPYFHGGRGEEMFQSQLDQVYVDKMTNASGSSLSDAMFNQMQRMLGKAEV